MKLFLDSATDKLVLALYDDTKLVECYKHMGKNDHSKTLMRELDNILKRNNLTLKDIDSLIVSNGPGSYTGVRIAVTVAKTLSLFNDIKLYKVSTLEAIATSECGVVAPIINARRGYVFGGIYEVSDKAKNIEADRFCLEEDFMKLVEQHNAKVINVEEYNLDPFKLNLIEADHYTLSPDYLREWGE